MEEKNEEINHNCPTLFCRNTTHSPPAVTHVGIDEDDLEFITTLAEGITFEFKALYCFDINSKTIETALLRYLEICVLYNNADLYCI